MNFTFYLYLYYATRFVFNSSHQQELQKYLDEDQLFRADKISSDLVRSLEVLWELYKPKLE